MFKENKRKIIFILLGLLVVSAIVVAYLVVLFANRDPDLNVIGQADAVAITRVRYFDGVFDSIFDELYAPKGIVLMGDSIIVADSMADRVQFITETKTSRVGLHGRFGLSYADSGAFMDGFREHAMFRKPEGVFVTSEGHILVSDTGNHAIRLIKEEFVITIAGNGTSGFADGKETMARFNHPRDVVMCNEGFIYVSDTLNHVIRRIDQEGNVNLFAGAAGEHGFIDGDLLTARFFEPSGLYITDDGVLYIADAANHSIRKIENGIVTTIAGVPGVPVAFSIYSQGDFIDGNNNEARFNFPMDIALMPNGDILVADSLNHAIRLITPDSTRTILGSGTSGQFYGSAKNLTISRPHGVATNGEMIFISDTSNNRVLAIELTQRILDGRPSRNQMLAETGLTLNSRFAFRGDIRVFLGDTRIDMGRVQPWLQRDNLFIPIRQFLEAVGAEVVLNETTGILSIHIDDTVTTLQRDIDYFILRGVMVTTKREMIRLFPYTIEWFPELSLITVAIPLDLQDSPPPK